MHFFKHVSVRKNAFKCIFVLDFLYLEFLKFVALKLGRNVGINLQCCAYI